MAGKDNPKNLQHLSGCPTGQELIPECEIVYEGESLDVKSAFEKCNKKSLHHKYIPVKDFDLHHLPEHLRTPRIKRLIELRCALTVRITDTYTSEHRPDTFVDSGKPYPYSHVKGSDREKRFGTGTIMLNSTIPSFTRQCFCLACRNSEDPTALKKTWLLIVLTSTHVIYDKEEARHSKFDCFFDSEDGEGVETFYGYDVITTNTDANFNYKSDLCYIKCAVHDAELILKLWSAFSSNLEALFIQDSFPPEQLIVSHPHGGSKQISVGKIRYVTVPVEPAYETNVPFPFKDNTICRMPLDVTPDVGENDLDLESSRQLFRQSFLDTGLFNLALVDRFLNTAPINETEIALNLLKRCLTAFLHVNSMTRLIANPGGSLRTLHEVVNFIITQRLARRRQPELIDIGWILWWGYLTCLVDFYKDFDINDKNVAFGNAVPHSLTLYNFLKPALQGRPYLREIFDTTGYLIEHSGHDIFRSREHLSYSDMYVTVTEILTGNDDVSADVKTLQLIYRLVVLVDASIGKPDICKSLKSPLLPGEADYLQPDKYSLLPMVNLTFTLPSTAKYAYRVYKDDHPYLVFHPGTTFHFTDRQGVKKKLPISDKTKFIMNLADSNMTYYVNYSTTTCPGSSGAFLYLKWNILISSILHVHSTGRMSHNRSGLTFQHGGIQNIKNVVQEVDDRLHSLSIVPTP